MGDQLLGKEVSGTPMETRGGASAAGSSIQDFFQGTGPNPFARGQGDAIMALLGFDPSAMGMEGAVSAGLRDPADVTRGLFASLEPFERRTTDNAVAENRDIFGSLGARFSPNLMNSEHQLRGELANQFATVRERSLLDANAQRNQFATGILGAQNQAGAISTEQIGRLLQFLSPGSPGFQPGILGDLIGGAGNIAATQIGGGGGDN